MPRDWRGYMRAHKGWLLLGLKDETGRWVERSSGIRADEPEALSRAEALLRKLRETTRAREDATGLPGPVTVRSWGERWIVTRADLADVESDRRRLELHVYPAVGAMLLEDVRPRHLDALAKGWAAEGYAPRTRRNIYSAVKALFRDARIAGLLDGPEPCILTYRQLGRPRDAQAGWRQTAVFTREELAALLSDQRIPEGRRIAWALLSLAFLRHGEMAGLRWRHIEAAEPLGRISVVTSYDRQRTKTDTERWCPIHPTLAAMLAEWRLSGWAREHGRPPAPDDLVSPSYRGRIRHKSNTLRFLHGDQARLGQRPRRVHDLRRTGISLAQSDGAAESVLRWATHAPPRHVMALYTTLEWEALCREVGKLRLTRTQGISGLPGPTRLGPGSGRA